MIIDLRSDTVTRPPEAMRRAMASAVVGDDVLDGDPTTARLEARIAELLGKEAALFFPSGTQANVTGLWLLAERGTELLVEADAHHVHYELAGVAALVGVQVRPVPTPDGILTADLARAAVRPAQRYLPRLGAVAVENTHNASGGRVMALDIWDGLVRLARELGLPVHLDGARLWNAAAALSVDPARVARGADTVMVSLSKGLGCPVGSCLAGSRALMDRGWELRKRLGGGLRQSGVLAAAALWALDYQLPRVAEDHAKARLIAQRLDGHPAVRPLAPETNIVMLDLLEPRLTAEGAVTRIERAGVRVVSFGRRRLRAVTHCDVSLDDAARAADVIAAALG